MMALDNIYTLRHSSHTKLCFPCYVAVARTFLAKCIYLFRFLKYKVLCESLSFSKSYQRQFSRIIEQSLSNRSKYVREICHQLVPVTFASPLFATVRHYGRIL